MAQQQPAFPLEVFELIIDELARKSDSISAVKACAVASRTFLPCCRKHLFKKIKLLPESENSADVTVTQHGRATLRLTAPLIINSNLAQYVRILHICVRATKHDDQLSAQMLRRLQHIETLSIESRRRDPDDPYTNWNDISTGVRTALEGIITFPSLVELHLKSIHEVPCYLLASARSLSHLSFLYVTFSIERPPEAQTLPIPHLKSLSFSNANAGITTLLQARLDGSPIVSFAHLKHLALPGTRPMEFGPATEILRLAKSIESLALVVSPVTEREYSNGMGENMLLASLETLKRFHATVRGRRPIWPDSLHCIPDILEKWAGINILEEFELDLQPASEGMRPVADEVERTLDILANRDSFPALRRVTVNVQHFRNRRGKLIEINGEPRRALMSLGAMDPRFCVNISGSYLDIP